MNDEYQVHNLPERKHACKLPTQYFRYDNGAVIEVLPGMIVECKRCGRVWRYGAPHPLSTDVRWWDAWPWTRLRVWVERKLRKLERDLTERIADGR